MAFENCILSEKFKYFQFVKNPKNPEQIESCHYKDQIKILQNLTRSTKSSAILTNI